MITPKAIYDEAEQVLLPVQPFVIALCIVIIAITLWAIIQPSASLRTAWVVYMFSP